MLLHYLVVPSISHLSHLFECPLVASRSDYHRSHLPKFRNLLSRPPKHIFSFEVCIFSFPFSSPTLFLVFFFSLQLLLLLRSLQHHLSLHFVTSHPLLLYPLLHPPSHFTNSHSYHCLGVRFYSAFSTASTCQSFVFSVGVDSTRIRASQLTPDHSNPTHPSSRRVNSVFRKATIQNTTHLENQKR